MRFAEIGSQGCLIKRNLSLVATDPSPESKSPPFDVEDTGQQTMHCLLHDKNAGTEFLGSAEKGRFSWTKLF